MASEYPILPPSPVSGVSSPWLAAGYAHSAVPTANAVESYQNVYATIPQISNINALSPPESSTPQKWELSFENEKPVIPTSTGSSPAPISAMPPILLPVSGSGPEELLQDSQLSGILIPSRQKTYTDAYWKHFHPVFPMIHSRQRFNQTVAPPGTFEARARRLLAVTMMAVGAQYSEQWFAPSDSRILLEKCLDVILKNRASILSTSNLELLQAVVLAEFLLQFKAKRAPESLSDSFCTVYDSVCCGLPCSQEIGVV
jgi:Fungal specific transcription factor domain